MSMHRSSGRSSMGRGRSSGGKAVVAFSVLVLLAGGGAGAWYYLRTPPPKLEAQVPPVAGEPVAGEAPAQPVTPPPAPATSPAAPPVAPPVASSTTPFVPVVAPAMLTPQTGNIQKELEQGMSLLKANKVVEGRAILSEVLFNYTAELKPENAAWIRAQLTEINDTYAYGKRNLTDDDITAIHKVESGDVVERIANKYRVPSGLLLQISGMQSAKSLQAGQKLKTILGPIHARVVKHEYRMDLYALNAKGAKIYLKSFPVGLGADDKTPVGQFRIGSIEDGVFRGKVEKPSWVDPDSGTKYASGAPDNPIGQFWIPLQGQEAATAKLTGYGIHGTVDPTSIGKSKSQGCVRLLDNDIKEIYHTVFCGKTVFSTLEILP